MSFLQKNYKLPKAQSNYMRLQSGDNKFRVVSSAIVGYEYWNEDNKPVRLKKAPTEKPKDIRLNQDDSYTIKHFWAFVVLDRWDSKVKILELTQKSVMESIKQLVDSEDWGDPKDYDINIHRTGEKLETKYTTQPSPKKPLTEEEAELVEKTKINLEALFTGGNPFDSTPDVNPNIVDVDELDF